MIKKIMLLSILVFVESSFAFNVIQPDENAYVANAVRVLFSSTVQTPISNSSLPRFRSVDLSKMILVQVPVQVPNADQLPPETPDFSLQGRVNQVNIKGNTELDLDGYLVDPVSGQYYPQTSLVEPNFNWGAPVAGADLSVAVRREILNQLILLSTARNIPGFQEIADANDTYKYTRPPQILALKKPDLGKYPKSAIVRVKISILAPESIMGFKEKLAFKGPFEIQFEGLCEIKAIANTASVDLGVLEADTSTLTYDESALTLLGHASKPIVDIFVRNTIDAIFTKWRSENKSLGITIALPLQATGLKLKIMAIDTRSVEPVKFYLQSL